MVLDDKNCPVKSVGKAMALLDRIALGDPDRRGVGLTSLAEEFGWPLNSTHNLLKTLVTSGYLALRRRGVYVAGPKCRQLAAVARCAEPGNLERIMAKLQEFVDIENEPCVCSVLAQGRRLVVASVESSHAVRISHATYEDAPFFSKATGRLLAAIAEPAELEEIIERHGLPGEHWTGIDSRPALEQALANLRQEGWCEMEDNGQQVIAMATPIPGMDGHAWGVLGTYAPTFRCTAGRRAELRRTLRRFANEMADIVAAG